MKKVGPAIALIKACWPSREQARLRRIRAWWLACALADQ